MMRRPRRQAQPGEFSDPLSDYRPRVYEDDFERFLDEAEVGRLEITPDLRVSPATPVGEVMRLMHERQIFCALVVEEDRLVGIFSERDVLTRVNGDFEIVKDLPIRSLMTADPVAVHAMDSPAKALNLMAVGGFRHVPVLDMEDRPIGVLGPRRVVRLLEKQFG